MTYRAAVACGAWYRLHQNAVNPTYSFSVYSGSNTNSAVRVILRDMQMPVQFGAVGWGFTLAGKTAVKSAHCPGHACLSAVRPHAAQRLPPDEFA